MDAPAQAKIIADIEARWTEALISERHRERAKLLVELLRQTLDDHGEVPEHHRGKIRGKMDSLTRDLHRISTNEMMVVSKGLNICGDSLPDPIGGVAFHTPLPAAEEEEMRAKYRGDRARARDARTGGGRAGLGWSPCGGPQQGWVHQPRGSTVFSWRLPPEAGCMLRPSLESGHLLWGGA
jgi:hypothetical protein